jgi:hypothetical protein
MKPDAAIFFGMLGHLFIGSLLLQWAWPVFASTFLVWHLPMNLSYFQCLNILWILQCVFPSLKPDMFYGVKYAICSAKGENITS